MCSTRTTSPPRRSSSPTARTSTSSSSTTTSSSTFATTPTPRTSGKSCADREARASSRPPSRTPTVRSCGPSRCGATRWCSTRTTKCKACTSTACPRSSPGARAGTDRAISASPAGVSRFLDPATTTPDVAPRRARRRRSSFFPRRPRSRRLSRTSSSFPRSGIWRGNARICSKPSCGT